MPRLDAGLFSRAAGRGGTLTVAGVPGRRAEILVQAGALFSTRVPATVWFLGLTSFLTDISSEMLVSSLPGYLVLHLGLTPLAFGVVDGLYHGLTSVARLASGLVADRWRRYKEVAFVGYTLSAICKAALVVASSGVAIGSVIAADRVGKGIRTAPRDAMIGMSVPPTELGGAFGVHRALDTAGAALGPLVAFAVLAWTAQTYSAVFVVSFAIAVIGLAALGLFVQNPAVAVRNDRTSARATLAGVMARPGLKSLLMSAVLLSIATVSDGFLYLMLQQRLAINPTLLPLMFAGTSLFFFLFAVPFGRAADRFGRRAVFLAGYGLLLVAYLLMLAPLPATARVAALLLLLGAYYAATDGVLAALTSELLPAHSRGAGLAVIATGVTLARFAASLTFGYLWTLLPASQVLLIFAVGLLVALLVAWLWLRPPAVEAVA